MLQTATETCRSKTGSEARLSPDPDWSQIPQELQDRDRWVLWRYETRSGRESKVPHQVGGKRASVTSSSTWSSFAAAREAYENGRRPFDGIGFVFTDGDPFAGVDLDECVDNDEQITAGAREIIERLDSYAEFSPSGRGVKIILRGQLPEGARHRFNGMPGLDHVELYDSKRFFTITGNKIPGSSDRIEERGEALQELYERLARNQGQPDHDLIDVEADSATTPPFRSDDEVLNEATQKLGTKFTGLYNEGDLLAYGGDDSHADLALCSFLGQYTSDRDQVDRLFRNSALYRDKWDEERGTKTYGEITIDRALQEAKAGNALSPWKLLTLADIYQSNATLDYIVDDLIVVPSLNIVYGAPGVFKSFLLADLATCIAQGRDWLPGKSGENLQGRATIQSPVLWLDLDNGERRTCMRMKALCSYRSLDMDVPFHVVSMPSPWFAATNETSLACLRRCLQERGARFCVIDNLGAASVGVDENSSGMATVMSNLRRLSEETNCAIVIVHHSRKGGGGGRRGDSLRGHSSIEAHIDLALHCRREYGANRVTIDCTKSRDMDIEPFAASFHCTRDPETHELASAFFLGKIAGSSSTAAAIRQAARAVVEREPNTNQTRLVDEVVKQRGIGEKRIREELKKMVEDGQLAIHKGDNNAKLFNLPPSTQEDQADSHKTREETG